MARRYLEDSPDIKSGAPSGILHVVAAVGAQEIIREGAEPRDDVGGFASITVAFFATSESLGHHDSEVMDGRCID